MTSENLSGKFNSCALTFASESERNDFMKQESVLLPEGSSYCVNIFEKFVEVKMPESFPHSVAGLALGECVLKQLTSQLYLPGTDTNDTGLQSAGSAGIP
jgi:hypothetical protein